MQSRLSRNSGISKRSFLKGETKMYAIVKIKSGEVLAMHVAAPHVSRHDIAVMQFETYLRVQERERLAPDRPPWNRGKQ